jgi:hypothetical protein
MTRGGGSGQNISQLFGSVLLFWYQDFSGAGDQNQVFMIKIRVFDDQIRASQGLSTVALHLGRKSPPHPQNTSAVVGNLK